MSHAVALACVDTRGAVAVADLLDGAPVDAVFSAEERRHCGPLDAVPRWAGRLAAKRAVLALAGATAAAGADAPALRSVEVVARPEGRCSDPELCRAGHRPLARHLPTGDAYAVSITHEHDRALAIATIQASEGYR